MARKSKKKNFLNLKNSKNLFHVFKRFFLRFSLKFFYTNNFLYRRFLFFKFRRMKFFRKKRRVNVYKFRDLRYKLFSKFFKKLLRYFLYRLKYKSFFLKRMLVKNFIKFFRYMFRFLNFLRISLKVGNLFPVWLLEKLQLFFSSFPYNRRSFAFFSNSNLFSLDNHKSVLKLFFFKIIKKFRKLIFLYNNVFNYKRKRFTRFLRKRGIIKLITKRNGFFRLSAKVRKRRKTLYKFNKFFIKFLKRKVSLTPSVSYSAFKCINFFNSYKNKNFYLFKSFKRRYAYSNKLFSNIAKFELKKPGFYYNWYRTTFLRKYYFFLSKNLLALYSNRFSLKTNLNLKFLKYSDFSWYLNFYKFFKPLSKNNFSLKVKNYFLFMGLSFKFFTKDVISEFGDKVELTNFNVKNVRIFNFFSVLNFRSKLFARRYFFNTFFYNLVMNNFTQFNEQNLRIGYERTIKSIKFNKFINLKELRFFNLFSIGSKSFNYMHNFYSVFLLRQLNNNIDMFSNYYKIRGLSTFFVLDLWTTNLYFLFLFLYSIPVNSYFNKQLAWFSFSKGFYNNFLYFFLNICLNIYRKLLLMKNFFYKFNLILDYFYENSRNIRSCNNIYPIKELKFKLKNVLKIIILNLLFKYRFYLINNIFFFKFYWNVGPLYSIILINFLLDKSIFKPVLTKLFPSILVLFEDSFSAVLKLILFKNFWYFNSNSILNNFIRIFLYSNILSNSFGLDKSIFLDSGYKSYPILGFGNILKIPCLNFHLIRK